MPSCCKYSFPNLQFDSFHGRPTFFLTGFLICSSRLPLSKNRHRPFIYRTGRPLFTERVDLGTAFSNISLSSTALFGPRNVRFEAMWFTVSHELVIQSQNNTMIILTIITSNAFLYLQIQLCDTKLKLSHYIGVARSFRRGGGHTVSKWGYSFFWTFSTWNVMAFSLPGLGCLTWNSGPHRQKWNGTAKLGIEQSKWALTSISDVNHSNTFTELEKTRLFVFGLHCC